MHVCPRGVLESESQPARADNNNTTLGIPESNLPSLLDTQIRVHLWDKYARAATSKSLLCRVAIIFFFMGTGSSPSLDPRHLEDICLMTLRFINLATATVRPLAWCRAHDILD